MGVYLPIDLTSKTPAEGLFQSNAAILELQRVENQLARLAPPSWPEDVFGRIDRDKAKAGKALFMNIAQAATTPGLTRGPKRTSTASASSWWDSSRKHTSAPTEHSSRPQALRDHRRN